MPINANMVNQIVEESEKLLQKKICIGVTKANASKAIKNAVEKVSDITNKETAKLRMQLNAEIGNLHKKIADLTSEKDFVEFRLNKNQEENAELKNRLQDISNRLTKAIKTRTGKEKILPNGNIETVKVNKNGARMTVETLSNEAKSPISYKVEDIDGNIRRTQLNPITGRPIKTYTDTNGGYLYEYLPGGTKVKRVNVKKVSDKPMFLNQQILEDGRDFAKIQRNFSNGTYEIIYYNKQNSVTGTVQKFDKNNKLIKERKLDYYNGQEGYKTFEYNPKTGKMTKYKREFDLGKGKKFSEKKLYAEDGITAIKSETVSETGMKRRASAKVNEFGFIDAKHPNIAYVYPKDSPIKTAKFGFDKQYNIGKETIKLKDGREVILKINNNYNPSEAVIKTKQCEIKLGRGELRSFLEDIGYRKGWNLDYTTSII